MAFHDLAVAVAVACEQLDDGVMFVCVAASWFYYYYCCCCFFCFASSHLADTGSYVVKIKFHV